MLSNVTVRGMKPDDIAGVVRLQRLCFPEPFPEEQLWRPSHVTAHLDVFPQGQLVVEVDGEILASASSCLISERAWQSHGSWDATLGGPYFDNFSSEGTTLYGADISVHPSVRRQGLGKALYEARFEIVRLWGLKRFGSACRLPGLAKWASEQGWETITPKGISEALDRYLDAIMANQATDRTLTPLLRMGTSLVGGVADYMEDEESLNCAALIEWSPSP